MNDETKQIDIFKAKIDNSSCFIDYFLEIGVKPDLFRETFLYESPLDDLNSKFKDKLTPTILSLFPPFSKRAINIDESVIDNIFPSGFSIIKSASQPSSVPFSLVLDNRFLSARYPYKYISCLLIYESIVAYKSLYDVYSNLSTGSLLSKHSSSSVATVDKEEYVSYYIPKCLCFVSVYPFLDSHCKLLGELHAFTSQSRSTRNKVLVDKLIENIVIEIPAPERGLHTVQYKFLDKEVFEYKQSQLNRLPSLDFEMEKIFKLFKVEDIVDVLRYLLQEVKVLCFSKYIRNLTPVILGFLSFLFPFKYPFQVVSILSESQFDFIESASPYVIGVNQSYTATFFKEHSIQTPMNVVIVNIDKGEVEVISSSLSSVKGDAQRKKVLSEEFPEFPHSLRHKLEKKLSKYITEVYNKKVTESREVYSKCFFSFIVKVLSTYSKHLVFDYSESHKTNGDISSLFNSKDYCASFNGIDKLFYKKLTETQMFIEFIYKRMLPRDANEKIEVLFFEEHLIRKSSHFFTKKANPYVFITSDAYNHTQMHQVSASGKLSPQDIDFFNQPTNRQTALLNGHYCEMLTNDEIIFTYYLFPSLLTQELFEHNIDLYYTPSALSKDFAAINSEMLLKANMSYGHHMSEMENYIYLAWVNLWALTFWYQQDAEKEYWFKRLLKVLDLIWIHELDLFDFLFKVLKAYGTKAMIIQLYANLIKYRLNPTWEIFTMMNQIDDHLSTKLKTLVKAKEASRGSGFNLNAFEPRTLKDGNDLGILTEEVLFYAYDNCINCQTSFDLFKECLDFKSMQREEMWVKCLHCGNNFLPTLKFRFGIELYNPELTSSSSSFIDNIVLDSPKYLRENLSSITHKERGADFDVNAFKLKYKKVFWNAIWYFKLMSLDITFMMPYLRKRTASATATVISNFLQFSTAKSICVPSSVKLLKRTTTMSEETMNSFDKRVFKAEKVIEIEVLPAPVAKRATFSFGMSNEPSVSFSALTGSNTDITSCINDNLFAENSMIIDNVSKFSEETYSDNEAKFKRNYNKLKSIKEDFEDALNFNNDNEEITCKSDEEKLFDCPKDKDKELKLNAELNKEDSVDNEEEEVIDEEGDAFNMDLKDAKCFGTFAEDAQLNEQYDEDEEERKRNIMFSFGKSNE